MATKIFYNLICINQVNAQVPCDITIEETSEAVKLNFKCGELIIYSEDSFPFIALKKIRAQLESREIFILCNGSRKDVGPSGMTLPTFVAYIMTMGKPALDTDLLNIFEVTQVEFLGTISQQEEYKKKWLESLKNN